MNDENLIEVCKEAFNRHICVGDSMIDIRAVAEKPTDTRRVSVKANGSLLLQGYFLNKTEQEIANKVGKPVNILIKSDRLDAIDSNKIVFEFVVYVG